MSDKLRVGILGGTGMVGQRFITLLENHPWFEVVLVAASGRSAGKLYEDAVEGRWKMQTPMPEFVKKMTVYDMDKDFDEIVSKVDFVFCAVNMPKDQIKAIEERYAKAEVPVVSNNSANRWTPDVPMVVPEINPEHLEVIKYQRERLGTGKTFEQWPEMVENIIPYIGGEEEKSEKEPLRLWGKIEDGKIVPASDPVITCQCIRVPVLDGHTAAVFVNFEKKPTKEQIIEKWRSFKGVPQELNLPSAPKQFIQYLEEDDRPQVKLDVNYENGMGVSLGRLREDSVFDYKFVGLSHNTLRGAAGGAVLIAELLKAQGYITPKDAE